MIGKFYVAILYEGQYDLITGVDWDKDEWMCDGDKPLEFTQTEARRLMRRIATHGVLAAVLEVASWYTL